VLLSESELHVNALANLAQHLIVLLDPADVVVNIHHAYGRPEFRSRRYACFHTGPSARTSRAFVSRRSGVRSLSILPLERALSQSSH
jgi:L-lactate dehydrogenase complex protein LldG